MFGLGHRHCGNTLLSTWPCWSCQPNQETGVSNGCYQQKPKRVWWALKTLHRPSLEERMPGIRQILAHDGDCCPVTHPRTLNTSLQVSVIGVPRGVSIFIDTVFFFFLIFHTLSFFFFPLRDSPISKSVISGSPFKADFSLCTKDQAEFWSQDTKDQVSLDLAQLFVGVWFLRELWHFVHNDQGLGLNLRHEFSHELNEEVGNFSSGSEKERVMSWSMRKLRRDERAWRMWIPYL